MTPLQSLDGRLVVVTGGAGFIGSHLVDALLDQGARVRVLDNLSNGRLENLRSPDQIEFIEGDIRDASLCGTVCRGAELLFHEAALGSVPRSLKDPATTVAVNVGGTANVFAAARDAGIRRVVYASSSSVYGSSATVPKREGEEGRPLSPYAASKSMSEQLAQVFAAAYGMQMVGLRYFNVYGPRQDPDGPYAAVIPRFFAACLDGQSPVIYGDGRQTRDFTFVSDVVAANLLAASAPVESAVCVNVGGGRPTTIERLAEMIREVAGSGEPPTHAAPRAGDVAHSAAHLALAESRIGYRPTVELPAGLARSRAHYAELSRQAR